MRVVSIAAAGVSVALIAATLAPASVDFRTYFAVGALICSAITLATIVTGRNQGPTGVRTGPLSQPPSTANVPTEAAVRLPPVNAESPPMREASTEAEVVGLLAALQEKGRLVDFLQDDITAYSDAQVGAAARVVHQGCKAVLNEYFHIVPVREESEGAKVTVPAGYVSDEYRLVGKISGQAPFSGTLMHRGWKAESVNLPRILRTSDDRYPAIAPAEVELR